ncbi:MAG: helix-turn-helix domain-containing protein [Accumulibacter sp.]|uniref:helix-turn-helix domain-containing protein n=1 Tax=Accumulibacter sp. TaxID=2053492 RepID=UPI0033152919
MSAFPVNDGTPQYGTASGVGSDPRLLPKVESSALAARLQAIIGKESVSSFARRCGLAESVLRTYLRDGRMPPLDKACAMAAAAGVSVDWLATGNGPGRAAEVRAGYNLSAPGVPASDTRPVDTGVLEGILKAVLEAQDTHAPPAYLAALIADLYRRAMDRHLPA